MEKRKIEEKEYHDFIRDQKLKNNLKEFQYYTSNLKYHSIARKTKLLLEKWLSYECQGKRFLDYCCGDGAVAVKIAKTGVDEIVGIDISGVSIENAKKLSLEEQVDKKTKFMVMDAENMEFEDNYFDIAYEHGALHHLNLEKAYSEIARVLKPNGKFLCVEALGHNPIIQYYREKTPHLRTEYETKHILRKKEIYLAKKYFKKVEILGFFYLFSLLAVPFRNFRIFNVILTILESIDEILLKLPILKWQAWQVVFVLSEPIKNSK